MMIYLRLFRCIALICVTIPVPKEECAAERPIVNDNADYIKGLFTPHFGGCYDMGLSGDVILIWTTFRLIWSMDPKGFSSILLAFFAPLSTIKIVMIRDHYSVDILLAVIGSELLYRYYKLKLEDELKELAKIEL